MKRLGTLLACIALIGSVPACSTLGAAGTAVQAATSTEALGDQVTFDERGMYFAEALYNVPAQAYVSADTRNIAGWASIKPVVRPLLIEARALLLTVREAYRLGDERSFRARVARLESLRDRIMTHLPAAD